VTFNEAGRERLLRRLILTMFGRQSLCKRPYRTRSLQSWRSFVKSSTSLCSIGQSDFPQLTRRFRGMVSRTNTPGEQGFESHLTSSAQVPREDNRMIFIVLCIELRLSETSSHSLSGFYPIGVCCNLRESSCRTQNRRVVQRDLRCDCAHRESD
jgi:hypothetical protein